MLGGDVVVAQLLGALRGVGDDGQQVAVGLRRRDRGARHGRQGRDQPLGAGAQGGRVGAGGGQQVEDVLVVRGRSSSASSRCAGVRSGLPSATARVLAALIASRLLLVSSASTGVLASSSLGLRHAQNHDQPHNMKQVESIPLKAVLGTIGPLAPGGADQARGARRRYAGGAEGGDGKFV